MIISEQTERDLAQICQLLVPYSATTWYGGAWYCFSSPLHFFCYFTYDILIVGHEMVLMSIFILIIGNSLFYYRKKHIWTYSSKIKVPQCSYYDYLFMYVCMYVFVYALSLQPTPFELTSWNLNQEVYIWSCPNPFFTFLKY